MEEAIKWYRKAADLGDSTAQFRMGYYYSNEANPVDYTKAREWYLKASENGEPAASGNLGWIYEYGKGVSIDIDEAVKWYQKGARDGNEYSQNQLKRLGKTW